VGLKELRLNEERLRSLLARLRSRDLIEAPECSTAERLFDERYGAAHFRSIDMNADGIRDILYSGYNPCAEGDITLLWLGAQDGLAERAPKYLRGALLKVSLGDSVLVCGVERGCCGDPVDRYFKGSLGSPHRAASVRIDSGMRLPADLAPADERYSAERETVLRSEPRTDDAYDPSASEHMAAAVLGTIRARYLPGATGRITATCQDGDGRRWGFVIVDAESQRLRSHNPFNVNAGWVLLE
jgi:hypothetical protein